MPYKRDEQSLARPWAIPGTPGLTHRIGGLEKEDITGAVCYDAANHQRMTELRAEKVERIAQEIPNLKIDGDEQGDLLLLGWGGTEGSIREVTKRLRADGLAVSRAHLNYINPFPSNLEQVLKNFKHVLVPEINMGQLSILLRDRFLIDIKSFNEVRGMPLRVDALVERAKGFLRPH